MTNRELNPLNRNMITYIWKDLPSDLDKCYIIPLADTHVGEPLFDERKFRGYLKWIADTPEAYCIFNGDLCNCGLPNSVGSDWWGQRPLTPHEQTEEVVSIVKEYNIKDKIIGIVGGSNHPSRARKLTGHDYDLQFAEAMGLKHLYAMNGLGVMVRLGSLEWSKGRKLNNGGKVKYIIYTTHGWAGGRHAGSSINAARELGAFILADIYIVSHRHLDSVTKDEYYTFDHRRPVVNSHKRMFITSGSFLKWGGYAQTKGLRPTGTGTPRIRLDGRVKDVHASV